MFNQLSEENCPFPKNPFPTKRVTKNEKKCGKMEDDKCKSGHGMEN